MQTHHIITAGRESLFCCSGGEQWQYKKIHFLSYCQAKHNFLMQVQILMTSVKRCKYSKHRHDGNTLCGVLSGSTSSSLFP